MKRWKYSPPDLETHVSSKRTIQLHPVLKEEREAKTSLNVPSLSGLKRRREEVEVTDSSVRTETTSYHLDDSPFALPRHATSEPPLPTPPNVSCATPSKREVTAEHPAMESWTITPSCVSSTRETLPFPSLNPVIPTAPSGDVLTTAVVTETTSSTTTHTEWQAPASLMAPRLPLMASSSDANDDAFVPEVPQRGDGRLEMMACSSTTHEAVQQGIEPLLSLVMKQGPCLCFPLDRSGDMDFCSSTMNTSTPPPPALISSDTMADPLPPSSAKPSMSSSPPSFSSLPSFSSEHITAATSPSSSTSPILPEVAPTIGRERTLVTNVASEEVPFEMAARLSASPPPPDCYAPLPSLERMTSPTLLSRTPPTPSPPFTLPHPWQWPISKNERSQDPKVIFVSTEKWEADRWRTTNHFCGTSHTSSVSGLPDSPVARESGEEAGECFSCVGASPAPKEISPTLVGRERGHTATPVSLSCVAEKEKRQETSCIPVRNPSLVELRVRHALTQQCCLDPTTTSSTAPPPCSFPLAMTPAFPLSMASPSISSVEGLAADYLQDREADGASPSPDATSIGDAVITKKQRKKRSRPFFTQESFRRWFPFPPLHSKEMEIDAWSNEWALWSKEKKWRNELHLALQNAYKEVSLPSFRSSLAKCCKQKQVGSASFSFPPTLPLLFGTVDWVLLARKVVQHAIQQSPCTVKRRTARTRSSTPLGENETGKAGLKNTDSDESLKKQEEEEEEKKREDTANSVPVQVKTKESLIPCNEEHHDGDADRINRLAAQVEVMHVALFPLQNQNQYRELERGEHYLKCLSHVGNWRRLMTSVMQNIVTESYDSSSQ